MTGYGLLRARTAVCLAVLCLGTWVTVHGVKLPSRRRAYRVDGQGNVLPDQLMVAIDVSDVRFE